jgi:hypothetical protein
VSAAKILALYREEECYPDMCTLFEDIARRYQLDPNALLGPAVHAAGPSAWTMVPGVLPLVEPSRRIVIGKLETKAPEWLLSILPDPEFLTAIETAASYITAHTDFVEQADLITDWLTYTDKVFRTSGLPYRLAPDTMTFEWTGEQATHDLAIAPALLALEDLRLAGAHDEFSEALAKRRLGAPKDLEDAVDEAAKSVESVLKVLHDERNVARPANEVVSQLFKSLKDARVLPQYISNLVTAPAGPRNNMASHGQGATVREVPAELADASIAAAATAITFLAHYLP